LKAPVLTTLLTLGHGTASELDLATLLRQNGIRTVVDVRSVPKSRVHPHVWKDRLAEWVPDLAGAAYVWSPALGGFRRPHADSLNLALRHPAFRGYADYMQTPEFLRALDTLLERAQHEEVAVMCSESLWWRCHRRLIADAASLLHGVNVEHIMHAGPRQPHVVTPEARVSPSGTLIYDR
jgi:uncharacterized protein (DUF488 family)